MRKQGNKKTRKIVQYLFWGLVLFSGCTEPFDIRTDDAEPKIVIYGVITGYLGMQNIYISSTAPYFSQEPNTPVSGATVSITSSTRRIQSYKEHPNIAGCYSPLESWCAEEGDIYSLTVEVDFDGDGIAERYEATTEVSHTVYLDSIKIAPINIMGHENYAVNIYGQDSPEEEYYLFRFYINGVRVNSNITDYVISDDIVFNGEYIDGMTIKYFNSITEYEKDSDGRRKESVYLSPGDRIDVDISIIPKGYYNFIIQCMNEKNGENPLFGGPPSNITSNISNGAIGFFTAYTYSQQSDCVK